MLLLYGVEAYTLDGLTLICYKSRLLKMFNTNSMDGTVNARQEYFSFELPSVKSPKRFIKRETSFYDGARLSHCIRCVQCGSLTFLLLSMLCICAYMRVFYSLVMHLLFVQ